MRKTLKIKKKLKKLIKLELLEFKNIKTNRKRYC